MIEANGRSFKMRKVAKNLAPDVMQNEITNLFYLRLICNIIKVTNEYGFYSLLCDNQTKNYLL